VSKTDASYNADDYDPENDHDFVNEFDEKVLDPAVRADCGSPVAPQSYLDPAADAVAEILQICHMPD